MMEDYSITWKYLVDKMKEKHDINPNSTERFSFGEIEYKLECIWREYYDKLKKDYRGTNREVSK